MPQARVGRALIAGCVCIAAACGADSAGAGGSGEDALRTDDTGYTVPEGPPARRIVSLIPAATEILFVLGAGPQLVARTDYCDYPPEVRELQSVGTGIRPAVEPILSLRPDLVLAFAGPDNAASIDRLRSLGVRLFAVRHNTVEDLLANIRRLGSLTGRTAAADSLARSISATLDSLAREAEGGTPVRVYYDLWGEPPHTIGGGSYLNDLIRVGGGLNVFGHLGAPSPQVNVEAVIEARPDVILLPLGRTRRDPVDMLRRRPGWNVIPAVRAGRVAAVDADLVHRLGPRLPEAARAVAEAIARGRADDETKGDP